MYEIEGFPCLAPALVAYINAMVSYFFHPQFKCVNFVYIFLQALHLYGYITNSRHEELPVSCLRLGTCSPHGTIRNRQEYSVIVVFFKSTLFLD